MGSRGDSYDNALAESVIGLFKTEVIRRRARGGRSRRSNSPPDVGGLVQSSTAARSDRLVPPAEYEARYYEQAAVA